MKIRFAQKKDLPQIIDLCEEHAAYEKAEYNPKNKSELLSNSIFGQNPVLNCLVAENDNGIIGYATFMKQFSTWDANFYIYLDCLLWNILNTIELFFFSSHHYYYFLHYTFKKRGRDDS